MILLKNNCIFLYVLFCIMPIQAMHNVKKTSVRPEPLSTETSEIFTEYQDDTAYLISKYAVGINFQKSLYSSSLFLQDRNQFIANLQRTEVIHLNGLQVSEVIDDKIMFDSIINQIKRCMERELTRINAYFHNGNNEVHTSYYLQKIDRFSQNDMIRAKIKVTAFYDYEDGGYPPCYSGTVTKIYEHNVIMPEALYRHYRYLSNCSIS